MGNKSGYTSVGKTAHDKATKFSDTIRLNGWLSKYTYDPETDITHVFARRGEDETLDVWWHGASCITQPKYTLAGEPIKLRNVSAAVAVAAKEADRSRIGRTVKRKARKMAPLGSPLSDDAGVAQGNGLAESISAAREALAPILGGTDVELKRELRHATVSWVNSQSGNVESAVVGRVTNIVRTNIHGKLSKPFVEFIDDRGFHAVYLDAIVGVR